MLIPVVRAPHSWPNYLTNSLPPNIIWLEVQVSKYEFEGRDTSIELFQGTKQMYVWMNEAHPHAFMDPLALIPESAALPGGILSLQPD